MKFIFNREPQHPFSLTGSSYINYKEELILLEAERLLENGCTLLYRTKKFFNPSLKQIMKKWNVAHNFSIRKQ